jgi:hypothetical protein
MEEDIGKRVNLERTDEALTTGADVVSTACPYCLIMLDDAVRARSKEDDVRVMDVSQVMWASLTPAGSPAVGSPAVGSPAAGTLTDSGAPDQAPD